MRKMIRSRLIRERLNETDDVFLFQVTLVTNLYFIEKSFVSRRNAEKCTKNKLFNRSEKVPVTDKRKSERAKNEKILRSEKL